MLIATHEQDSFIIVDGWRLRAAQEFQAKNDYRFYLNGVCLHSDGRITGTCGHKGFTCEAGFSLSKNVIISISGKIPLREVAEIRFTNAEGGTIKLYNKMVFKRRRKQPPAFHSFSVIDGKFPDIKKAFPEGDLEGCPEYLINGKYLAGVQKAFEPHCEIKIQSYGKDNPIVIKSGSPERQNASVLIMGMRF